jgi:hypothetical protein
MKTFAGGTPPGPHCGETSPITTALRPKSGLSHQQEAAARRHRRSGASFDAIAATLQVEEEQVRLAARNLRVRKSARQRTTVNATNEAATYLASLGEPDEPMWSTLDRVLGEHALLKAYVSGLRR